MNIKKMYLIGDVSHRVKLSQKRIREYEKEGFIVSIRDSKTNNRLYTDFDINQIKQINNLIHQHGFTISCLKTLLESAPCWNIFNCKKIGDFTSVLKKSLMFLARVVTAIGFFTVFSKTVFERISPFTLFMPRFVIV